MRQTLNAGESPIHFPAHVSELQSAGLCAHCIEHQDTRPTQAPELYLVTEEEIEDCLSDLEESL